MGPLIFNTCGNHNWIKKKKRTAVFKWEPSWKEAEMQEFSFK